MKLLVDTNVVLDVLLDREPWIETARELWRANDHGQITGYLTATTLTDIFYIARKVKNLSHAHAAVLLCLEAFDICPVDREALELAIALPGSDFEDNLQIAAAMRAGLDAIVTRNRSDYGAAPIAIFSPEEALTRLK